MLLAGGDGGAFVELQRASLRRGIRPGMSSSVPGQVPSSRAELRSLLQWPNDGAAMDHMCIGGEPQGAQFWNSHRMQCLKPRIGEACGLVKEIA